MRLLGIDYGSKRIGIAVSDETAKLALPLIVLENKKNILKEIEALAKKNNIKTVVIGESKNYNGEPNKILAESLVLKEDLERSGFVVEMEPEFMTSVNAERFQGKNEMLDASAAALILQSFIDRQNMKKV